MLRKCLLFTVVAVGLVAADLTRYPSKSMDSSFYANQKKIYDLFMYVSQEPLPDTEYFEVGRHYDIAGNVEFYTNREAVEEFLYRYKFGMLKKDALFTYYNEQHRDELLSLYYLFYYAKDFSTFYKTACWARIYMNPALFITAFTAAMTYREDCKAFYFPYIYEICPHAFFDSKMIRQAQFTAMSHGISSYAHHLGDKAVETVGSVETYHLYSNFSDSYMNYVYNSEYELTYFTHDVTLNSYYYYFRMMYPFFISNKGFKVPTSYRGEIYFFIHQQLMARYFLERYSNGFKELDYFSFEKFNLPSFYYSYTYPNGVSMPQRDWWNVVPFYKLKYFEYLKALEIRIFETIDSGYFFDEMGKRVNLDTPEGLNYLGNLVEGNYDSKNFKYFGSYDALARDVFGADYNPQYKDYNVPSALQYFSTSMKDPAFYRIYSKIVQFFLRYKSFLGHYPKNELEFSGVRFESVDISKLMTYYENKDFFINNAVGVESSKYGRSFAIKAYQYQLNYKPFSYKFTINSDKTTKGIIRIFLGPAYNDEYTDDYSFFLRYYKYFFMVDEFVVNLKEGMNSVERSSNEAMHAYKQDYSFESFYKSFGQDFKDKESFSQPERQYSFPHHLYLPKGSPEGMKFKFFFYIGPYEEGKPFQLPFFGKRVFFNKSLGYPLDRPVSPFFFQLGNVYLKDMYIYHKKDYAYGGQYDETYKSYFHGEHQPMSTDFSKFHDFKYPQYTTENYEEPSVRESNRPLRYHWYL